MLGPRARISGSGKKMSDMSSSRRLRLWARTPLTIVVHILPGRRVVVGLTLAAIGSISARYHRAGACLSAVGPAAADMHRIATADAAEPHGEGRGSNC
jgi:hypothetical protein